MSNADWTGVPLRVFLEKAGIKPEAKVVVFRCRDSYHTAIPIADAMREETLLAYKMNGVVLPKEHGFSDPAAQSRPLRHKKSKVDHHYRIGKEA